MDKLMPIYLLMVALFALVLNLKAGSRPGKWVSYILIWVALGASGVAAFVVYR